MRHSIRFIAMIVVSLFMVFFLGRVVLAWEPPDPRTYLPTTTDFFNAKAFYDDPRSRYVGPLSLKNRVPKDLYEKLLFPVDEMKKEWADVVGFKSPDLVGKKCPEIKPGKYTYKDLEKYPCFKELFWPEMYNRIKPGGPPFAGNIPEFEIVPTIQYYHPLPVSRMTKENAPKVKTDNQGYLIPTSWEGGYPFPRPSGPNKALQIMINLEKRYISWDGSFGLLTWNKGYRKNLSEDFEGVYYVRHLKIAGRAALEPYGWLDERGKSRGEVKTYLLDMLAPRDSVGTALTGLYYLDTNKADLLMIYVSQLRRIRMMTSSDSQDPMGGQDAIYDDNEGFLQKLSPTHFPYKWELIGETEYLAPFVDNTEYITKKGLEMRNVKFMRRPTYVVQGTQLDKSYVYSKRIFYIDMETFLYNEIVNYDQKGRLYRTFALSLKFAPEMGVWHGGGQTVLMKDHIDTHSSYAHTYDLPAFWKRKDLSLEGYVGAK